MNKWCLTAAFALLTLSARANAVPPAQSPWLASVSSSGGMPLPPSVAPRAEPEFIVYADGTAVWPRALNGTVMWRTGTVSGAALKQFQALVTSNNVFTIKPLPATPTPGGAAPGPVVADALTSHIAVQFGGKRRVVGEYALEASGQPGRSEAYRRVMLATRTAILALKPSQSGVYKPSSVRVSVTEPPNGTVFPIVIRWPLPDTPAPTLLGKWLVYSGANAQTVLDTIASSPYVMSGNHVYALAWTPNIDIPMNAPTK